MHARRRTGGCWLLAAILIPACTRAAAPPSADAPQLRPPDLTGASVMVLPAQHAPGGATGEPVAGLDREIAYWLAEQVPRVRWVFPQTIASALARNPAIDVRIDALAVQSFHRAEVKNIGDPLFGELRSIGALVDARFALVPVAAAWVADGSGSGSGRAEVRAALIDTLGGRVLWTGTIAGDVGAEGSQAVAASAARALARLLAS